MRSLLFSLALGAATLFAAAWMPNQAHAQMRWARQNGWGTYYGNYSPSYVGYYQGYISPSTYGWPNYYGYGPVIMYGGPAYNFYPAYNYQNFTRTYSYPVYTQGYWPYQP